MRDKRLLWFASILAGLMIICGLMIRCSPDINLELGDYVTAIEHDDGRTEIMLTCINQSTAIAYDVIADVSIEHNETKEIFDRIIVEIGDVLPGEEKKFSAWTDKLTFGADIGVSVFFTCKSK